MRAEHHEGLARATRPHTFLAGSQRGLDDRPQAEPHIGHPSARSPGRMDGLTRHMHCSLGCRKLQERLNRAERLVAHVSDFSLQPPPVLRFCLGWCQTSYHARTMPPDTLLFCVQKNADVLQEQPRRDHPSRHYSGGVAPCTSLHQKKRRLRHLRSRPPFTCCLLGLEPAQRSFCNRLRSQNNDTSEPTWPLPRRNSAATSEKKQPGDRDDATRTQSFLSNLCDAHTHSGHFDGASHPRRLSFHGVAPDPWGRSLVGGQWDADFVCTALQRSLHIPFFDQGSQCTRCGQVLDCFCDHATAHAREIVTSDTAQSPMSCTKPPKKQDSVLRR